MSLSIFTSASSMSSTNAMNKANNLLSTAMERLGTGKRINSAADDAAGLQIATRLQGQTNGMTVAQRNISDATALLQTAEGAFDEVSNIMYRMKDLATQAANDTNGTQDRDAISAEMTELNKELSNIMGNTKYAGENLFQDTKDASGNVTASAKFTSGMNFQIGSSTGEKLNVDVSAQLSAITSTLSDLESGTVDSFDNAQDMISKLDGAIGEVGTMRSSLGANINRLGHTAANLANMKDNTDLALSNIQDADYATEASTMTRNQLLAQTSMSMLKTSNSMSSMVMNLLG